MAYENTKIVHVSIMDGLIINMQYIKVYTFFKVQL